MTSFRQPRGGITKADADAAYGQRRRDQSQTTSPLGSLTGLRSKGAVLTIGAAGQFDAGYIESPNVFFDPASGRLKMLYTGYSAATSDPATVASVGIASSVDGLTWSKEGQVFSGSGVAGSPDRAGVTGPVMVIGEDGLYHLFYIGLTEVGYEGGQRSICHATASSLAGPWTRQGSLITKSGDQSSWRWYAVWHPNLVFAKGKWHLFFNASGNDKAGHANVETIGYATSPSLNGPWTVDDANSPIVPLIQPTDQVVGDPYVWREGDHWRMDFYRADSTYTTIGAYYATTSDDAFPLGWTHRGQVTSAAANQGAKPVAIRFNGATYYYASFGVNIFLSVAPDVTNRDQVVDGTWRFAPDRSSSGRASALVGDDLNFNLANGTRTLMVGSATSSSYLVFGQSNSRNLLIFWQWASGGTSAIAKIETFAGSNPIQIQNNTGQLILGGSGGRIGFFGTTPILKRAATADATDLASVITLANALKADLVAYGLKS